MLAAFALRAIRSVQVLVEMDAFRRQGQGAWTHFAAPVSLRGEGWSWFNTLLGGNHDHRP